MTFYPELSPYTYLDGIMTLSTEDGDVTFRPSCRPGLTWGGETGAADGEFGVLCG
ncbi:hypothetical protein [Actinoplanes derwentensis]|uniref:Uncharacterized protein n=1 Tax=Actinoplanes derwentensis TaxID=113562 RepID=A0A1H1ZZM7_9ACTN|nr:hypothetical protein [Actinoplanes derwentensis]GID83463.1 hypothetical protein Ade03nite_23870 [Actinoplanes derwentensis]SDT38987.1 hypothetical protein SAMN04489716_3577 [Actinoplanes derwentensis]